MLTSGHLLADRYRLARRIAVGGMGEVWEAEDARLDRRVAVKVLKAELCGDAEFLHRFRTEARTTASLNHPGVAGVHDYGETAALADGPQDTAYLVMELVEGEPLSAVLARDGRLSVERTLDMLEQSGHALQAAHSRGLVHRDIKPGNILLTPTGVVKLTDFGIAKAADAAPVTRSGMVMGTAHYIAPEQAVGQEAEPASDVYSLAVVGYECLTGHRPFLSENAVTVAMMHIRDLPPPLPHDVPPGVRALIEATLAKDPRKRYPTGGEFAVAVVAVRTGYPLPTPSGYAMGSGYAMDEDTPPTGTLALSPRLAGAGPHTGPHTGMLPSVPRQRSRAWLWLLIVLLFLVAVGLTVWSVVATNAKGGSGSEQPRGQVRTSQAPSVDGPTGAERPPEAGAGPGGAGSGAGGPTGSGRAGNGTGNNGGGQADRGSGHRYGSPGGPGNGAGGGDTGRPGSGGGGATPAPDPEPTDGGGTGPNPPPTDGGGVGRRIAPAPSKPFDPPTTDGRVRPSGNGEQRHGEQRAAEQDMMRTQATRSGTTQR